MYEPRQISPGSIMPEYPWLQDQSLDISSTPRKINALRKIGVPYEEGYEDKAVNELMKQADEIALDLQKNGAGVTSDKEIIALIAYLQRLGTDIKGEKSAINTPSNPPFIGSDEKKEVK